ncbi:hypothetical protein ScPMuIL_014243 [Solemya velum]
MEPARNDDTCQTSGQVVPFNIGIQMCRDRDVHETALADKETFTDFDFDTGLPVNQYKQESRRVETKHLEGETTPVKQITSFDCDNRLDDEPFASYTPTKVLYKPYRQFEYEQESRSVETKI